MRVPFHSLGLSEIFLVTNIVVDATATSDERLVQMKHEDIVYDINFPMNEK